MTPSLERFLALHNQAWDLCIWLSKKYNMPSDIKGITIMASVFYKEAMPFLRSQMPQNGSGKASPPAPASPSPSSPKQKFSQYELQYYGHLGGNMDDIPTTREGMDKAIGELMAKRV